MHVWVEATHHALAIYTAPRPTPTIAPPPPFHPGRATSALAVDGSFSYRQNNDWEEEEGFWLGMRLGALAILLLFFLICCCFYWR